MRALLFSFVLLAACGHATPPTPDAGGAPDVMTSADAAADVPPVYTLCEAGVVPGSTHSIAAFEGGLYASVELPGDGDGGQDGCHRVLHRYLGTGCALTEDPDFHPQAGPNCETLSGYRRDVVVDARGHAYFSDSPTTSVELDPTGARVGSIPVPGVAAVSSDGLTLYFGTSIAMPARATRPDVMSAFTRAGFHAYYSYFLWGMALSSDGHLVMEAEPQDGTPLHYVLDPMTGDSITTSPLTPGASHFIDLVRCGTNAVCGAGNDDVDVNTAPIERLDSTSGATIGHLALEPYMAYSLTETPEGVLEGLFGDLTSDPVTPGNAQLGIFVVRP